MTIGDIDQKTPDPAQRPLSAINSLPHFATEDPHLRKKGSPSLPPPTPSDFLSQVAPSTTTSSSEPAVNTHKLSEIRQYTKHELFKAREKTTKLYTEFNQIKSLRTEMMG